MKKLRYSLGVFVRWVRSHTWHILPVVVLLTAYYFCLPEPLFKAPLSTVVESREGKLLGAQIAQDGQWRFPEADSIPEKFTQCILHFEDAYFYYHPGFNPVSIVKSIAENIKAEKIVRGGSSLTQQVIRLSRKGKNRTYLEKMIEILLATRLELRYSKKKIIQLYASYAPFGSNVVGLDAASWRYFGREPHELSWAESATLAVLPNAPSLVYPGKNQSLLLKKRNVLLKKLLHKKIIDPLTYQLAITEDLPQRPFPLPQTAPHLLQHLAKKYEGKRVKTTLPLATQHLVNGIVKKHYENLRQNHIYNAAVLVMEVATRNVVAYVGNTPTDAEHEKEVNIIMAARSTGSVLKPFLYTAMLDAGALLPTTLVADVPTQIAGYSPQNAEETYSGAIAAKRALARSLNVPAVRLLQTYGLERFRQQLGYFGLKGIDKPADYYGLTLILGGAESNLWDLCKSYATMASVVNHFTETSGEYFKNELIEPVLVLGKGLNFGEKRMEKQFFDAGSIYLAFEAMKEVNRPEGNDSWEFFDSSKEIAWKTGTSFGNRDAWAIGVTKDYVVGVWAGNADGEGRPQLSGITSAAPILFDVFDVLPRSAWFSVPYDALTPVEICTSSGYIATDICPKKILYVPRNGERFNSCPFHRLIHVDAEHRYRVNASCESPGNMSAVSWFVLPPLMEYYYKNANPGYRPLPPFREGCLSGEETTMDFIYPKTDGIITLPKGFDGKINDLILKITHTKPGCTVFWYLDDVYLGETHTIHEMIVAPTAGLHTITVVDDLGNELKRSIEIVR